MRVLLLILSLMFTSATMAAGSLDCTFSAGQGYQPVPETAEGYDPEEESENYKLVWNEKITAEVLYLPFQDGITVTLSDSKLGVEASTTNREYSDISLKTKEGRFLLMCAEIE